MSIPTYVQKQSKAAQDNAQAALHNELITRQRVDALTAILSHFLNLPFKDRVRWMLFGPPKPVKKVEASEPVAQVAQVEEPSVH